MSDLLIGLIVGLVAGFLAAAVLFERITSPWLADYERMLRERLAAAKGVTDE